MSLSNIDLDAARNIKDQFIYDNVKALTNGEERVYKSFSSSRDGLKPNRILDSCAGVTIEYCAAQCVDCGMVYYPDIAVRGVPTIWIGERCSRCGSFDFKRYK